MEPLLQIRRRRKLFSSDVVDKAFFSASSWKLFNPLFHEHRGPRREALETSKQFQNKLCRDDLNLEGHGVLSDSAFPVSGDLFGKIVTPLKDGDLERSEVGTRAVLAALSSAITSMRQAAEWGMGAVEKPYRRLLEKLPFDQKKRGRRMRNMFRLYNFRVRSTGISQIRSYFDSP